jgi:hypothetical protein
MKAVYVDSEFYDGKCLTLMQAHNHAYVMPIIEWGTKIKQELSEGWSCEIEHDLTTEYGEHEWTVDTVVRDYFRDRDTYFEVRGLENRVLTRHGGKESRTTVSITPCSPRTPVSRPEPAEMVSRRVTTSRPSG